MAGTTESAMDTLFSPVGMRKCIVDVHVYSLGVSNATEEQQVHSAICGMCWHVCDVCMRCET
jgi:hypothetical protein